LTNVWCVQAGGGIGWRQITEDLSPVRNRKQLFSVVRRDFPDIQSAILQSCSPGTSTRSTASCSRSAPAIIIPAAVAAPQATGHLVARHWTHPPAALRDRLSLEQVLVKN